MNTVKARVQIRRSTYRCRPGFKILGKDTYGRKVSIFVKRRATADAIKGLIYESAELSEIDKLVRTEGDVPPEGD